MARCWRGKESEDGTFECVAGCRGAETFRAATLERNVQGWTFGSAAACKHHGKMEREERKQRRNATEPEYVANERGRIDERNTNKGRNEETRRERDS
ncbi:hypothetical protein R1flu_012412 [Riccia fluitans]|uniref:Uncharacterized protein n=1 Tax=Riccia fluitans TaxID=41844 RepID=A0ABD1ZBI9_9MARC